MIGSNLSLNILMVSSVPWPYSGRFTGSGTKGLLIEVGLSARAFRYSVPCFYNVQ
jgi:hypothetical protein